MKNWKLNQELNALRSEYNFGNNKIHTFRRTDDSGKEYYPMRSSTQIIDNTINYIESLEFEIEELRYVKNIVDEVNKQK